MERNGHRSMGRGFARHIEHVVVEGRSGAETFQAVEPVSHASFVQM
jgi:hypothetical protein